MVVRSLFGMNRVLYYCNKLNLGIDCNLEQIDVKKYILDIYSDRYMLNDVIRIINNVIGKCKNSTTKIWRTKLIKKRVKLRIQFFIFCSQVLVVGTKMV